MKRIFTFLFISLGAFFLQGQNPTFQWAKTFAVNNPGYSANKIVSDNAGNIYTAGGFVGTIDLDPGPGTFTVVSGDGIKHDIFVSKFDGSGNFMWGKSYGAFSYDDLMYGMTIDATNNIYLTGSFFDVIDFGPGTSTLSTTNNFNSEDTYILKLDEDGGFVWAKQLSDSGSSVGVEIAVDGLSNVYVTGGFNGKLDLDPGPGTYTSYASRGLYVSKLNSSGNFVWGQALPFGYNGGVNSITIDRSGNSYLTGSFHSTVDFDPGAPIFNLTSLDQGDIFLLKLDPSGNFSWAKSFPGLGNDNGIALVVDSSQNIIVGGAFKYVIDFDPGPGTYTLASFASDDAFILKLDGAGNFIWAKSFGESRPDFLYDLAIDAAQNVYSTGGFEKTVDFDPGSGTFNLTSVLFYPNGFIQKLDPNGNFLWAGSLSGSTSSNGGQSILIDKFNCIYLTGLFAGPTDFNPGASTFTLYAATGKDPFILKLNQPLVDIQEFENISDLDVYPNPNNGSFTIELNSNSLVTVTNVLGEEILSQILSPGKQKFNLEALSSGIYFVSVKEKDAAPITQRIIITK